MQPDSEGTTRERLHGLDAARGVLMSLGVLLHTANIYRPEGGWLVSDVQHHWFFGVLSSAIHIFRMPAFFWVAGYFCALTLDRSGPSGLLESRLPRLVVPLIASLLTLNLAQDALIAVAAGKSLGDVLSRGVSLSHLWFLVNLIAYVVLAALIFSNRRVRSRPLQGTRWESATRVLVVVVLISYAFDLLVRATGLAYVDFMGITSLYQLARYAPYFAFGFLMYGRLDFQNAFLRQSPWLFLPAVALALMIDPMTRGPAAFQTEAAQVLKIALVWTSVGSLHAFFYRRFQRKSQFTEVAAHSSYTIYLFHHIIVVALGLLFVRLSLSPFLEFGLIVATTLTATLCIHYYVIERFTVLRLAFNGRTTERH